MSGSLCRSMERYRVISILIEIWMSIILFIHIVNDLSNRKEAKGRDFLAIQR